MIAAYSPPDARSICVAVHEHRRGNPVLWARRFFSEIESLQGDVGARSEEHTSELQSQSKLVCRLLSEKKTALKLKRSSLLRFQPSISTQRRPLPVLRSFPTRRSSDLHDRGVLAARRALDLRRRS